MWLETQNRSKMHEDEDEVAEREDEVDEDDFADDDEDDDDDDEDDDEAGSVKERSRRSKGKWINSLTFLGRELRSDEEWNRLRDTTNTSGRRKRSIFLEMCRGTRHLGQRHLHEGETGGGVGVPDSTLALPSPPPPPSVRPSGRWCW